MAHRSKSRSHSSIHGAQRSPHPGELRSPTLPLQGRVKRAVVSPQNARSVSLARGGRIPVMVVTGFLGAGKTTLVRRFLTMPEGQGTAVVINEFGSVGIDDAL